MAASAMLSWPTFNGEFLAGDDHRCIMFAPEGRVRPMVAFKEPVLGIEACREVGLGAGYSPIVAETTCGSRAPAHFDHPTLLPPRIDTKLGSQVRPRAVPTTPGARATARPLGILCRHC